MDPKQVTCPKCEAAPGQPCKSRSFTTGAPRGTLVGVRPHRERIQSAAEVRVQKVKLKMTVTIDPDLVTGLKAEAAMVLHEQGFEVSTSALVEAAVRKYLAERLDARGG